MRLKLSLAVAATLVSAGTAMLLSAPSVGATTCPPGTVHARDVKLPTGGTVAVCLPGQECDPRPCDPTAAPARD